MFPNEFIAQQASNFSKIAPFMTLTRRDIGASGEAISTSLIAGRIARNERKWSYLATLTGECTKVKSSGRFSAHFALLIHLQ